MSKESYFLLFANCIPVKGLVRSGICDVQCGVFETIPNSMFDILSECEQKSVEEIYSEYSTESHKNITKFFDWLIEKNFGIWCKDKNERELFPKMNMNFDYPFHLSNIIIDVDANSEYDAANLFRQVVGFGIPYVQLRSYSYRDLAYYTELLRTLEGSRVIGVDLVIPYFEGAENIEFNLLCKEYLRINSITFTGAPFNRSQQEIGGNSKIAFTTVEVHSNKCCGVVSSKYFMISKELLLESLHANNCLNRKISVDVRGEIKNCPSLPHSYGNISDVKLADAYRHPAFKNAWSIRKDEVSVCKTCEFRYICTDCRAFVENPEDPYSKPLKCGYDPFTGKWSEWSTNPLKEKAMKHYGFASVNSVT